MDITDSNNMFTYCHASLNSHSFIDNFLPHSAAYCDVINCSIDDSGTNFSDYSAVILSIKMSDPHSIKHTLPSKPAVQTRLTWDKANVAQYYQYSRNLSDIGMSMFTRCTLDCKCGNVQMIEYLYNSIVSCLVDSA